MKKDNYVPKVGDLIGGLCEVIAVDDNQRIRVKEDPDTSYSWECLAKIQDKLKKKFGQNRGYPRPDHRPEFNRLD